MYWIETPNHDIYEETLTGGQADGPARVRFVPYGIRTLPINRGDRFLDGKDAVFFRDGVWARGELVDDSARDAWRADRLSSWLPHALRITSEPGHRPHARRRHRICRR